MKTAVVILNWNTRSYLETFLPGLIAGCEGLDAEVVVADSASTDGSLEMVAEKFPSVRTVALDANYGFTGGYNRALAQIDAEYYLLINSDIEVEGEWLKPLVDWMDSHSDCGVCGPKLHALVEEDGHYARTDRFEYAGAAGGFIDRFGYPYCRGRVLSRTEEDHGQYDTPADVMWVTGACLLTRSSLWKSLGGLDDRFFAHMEEIDYCWRAQLAGWKVTTVPSSCVWHLGGGTLPQNSPFKLRLNYRNNLLLLQNNLAPTFSARGLDSRMAFAKARRIILERKTLDAGSAIVYLLTGHLDYMKAVFQAHAEARNLSRNESSPCLTKPEGGSGCAGYSNICIILQSILRRGGVFEYLRTK